MATIKSYTDLSQSKVLAKILPLESADLWWSRACIISDETLHIGYSVEPINLSQFKYTDEDIPCWSLAALFNLCPTINEKQPILTRGKLTRLWYCYYEDEIDTQTYDNPVDACVEMILKLKEQNLL